MKRAKGGRGGGIGRTALAFAFTLMLAPVCAAQNGRTMLSGQVRPALAGATDLGRAEATLTLHHVTVMLLPSAAQEADLTALLARQQDPASQDYHRWLTPEQYGARFGLAQAEIARVSGWLSSENLTVDEVGRGRITIAFTGGVRDVERAFGVEIHRYLVNGERHYANAEEPSVPAALGGAIRLVRGLDDFRRRPMARAAASGPAYTSLTTGGHYLAPEDVATIFDVSTLYNRGITGSGQKIVVVGQTQVNLSDIEGFRTFFNLSANDPQMVEVPGTPNPGISQGDLPEADLDLEWAGAMARDASILFVYSDNVDTSAQYAIDQDLAPVITMSYGLCEALTGTADLAALNVLAQQANAEGISWIAAAGDSGANTCFGESNSAPNGLSVDAPASVPGVTGVGGTEFSEGSGTYWNATNDANHGSALGYIPEVVWNDSVVYGSPDAGGGGASIYFTKPVWQAGPGVPNDSARDVPDIALPASNEHDAYIVNSSGALLTFGGTSVSAPVFAGIAGLLNQYAVASGAQKTAGLGNLNPRLYGLAVDVPGVFHDVTLGNNMVESCDPTARGCAATTVGYDAGPRYDQASGWGSVDAFGLAAAWGYSGTVVKAAATAGLSFGQSVLEPTDSTTLTATVTGGGASAPSGAVTFYAGGVALGSATLTGAGLTSKATLSATAAELSAGSPEAGEVPGGTAAAVTPTVSAVYPGDAVYGPAAATGTITVVSATAMFLSGMTSAASYQRVFAPGMIVAAFGLNLAGSTPATPGSPLPTQLVGTTVTVNGIAAPLYYVSPTQINLQVPYGLAAGSSAIVKVTANGQTATSELPISANAPEIFADTNGLLVPYQTTARGQAAYLFETGDGLFAPPAVTNGAVPAGAVSTTPQSVAVTVGGVAAATSYVGVPSWSIGVTQVNFTIPANAPTGVQPVVVTVGGVASAPVFITVTS